jgi:dimethylargininase
MLKNEGERLKKAVVCSPKVEYFNVDDLNAHNFQEFPNKENSIAQHSELRSVIQGFGAEVIDAPELLGHPNSVFTRDTAICTPEGYIKVYLGLETRQGEEEWMALQLDALGEPSRGAIDPPGWVEGGDVVLAGSVAFIGLSIRTNKAGILQLSQFLKKMGYDVRIIPLPEEILHLDKVLMTVRPDVLLYCDQYVNPAMLVGFDTIEMSFGGDSTANVICLGDGEVIVNRSNREAIDKLTQLDFTVHDLDLSEFAKGTGGPNCLIMPVDRR